MSKTTTEQRLQQLEKRIAQLEAILLQPGNPALAARLHERRNRDAGAALPVLTGKPASATLHG